MNTSGSPKRIQVDFGDRVVDEELKRKVTERLSKLNKVIAENSSGGSGASGMAKFDNTLTLKRCHEKLAAIVRYKDGKFISEVSEYRELRDMLCSQFALMGLDTPTTMMMESEFFQGKNRTSVER